MKTISLSVLAIVFACASVFANGHVTPAKVKATKVSCSNCGHQQCAKGCAKTMCPKGACKM